jgi:hypothetical protein
MHLRRLVPAALILAVSCGGGGSGTRTETAEELPKDTATNEWCRDFEQAFEGVDVEAGIDLIRDSDISGLTPQLKARLSEVRALYTKPLAPTKARLEAIGAVFSACEEHAKQVATDAQAEQETEGDPNG